MPHSTAVPTSVPPTSSTTENGTCPCSLSSTTSGKSFEPGVIGRHGWPWAREWVTTSS
ncbi:hypothetical protein [Nonomuraea turcica]|uniref:hypothetical protein n=1 Tax=Nonomuraea sp. G32 TaxID=3067274 RepID=UPI00273C7834|nr:hypothetical protein [Nonomuraea sp. G32]MDP4505834.1 hypothetical protein [Nonomuraea sp. G32]